MKGKERKNEWSKEYLENRIWRSRWVKEKTPLYSRKNSGNRRYYFFIFVLFLHAVLCWFFPCEKNVIQKKKRRKWKLCYSFSEEKWRKISGKMREKSKREKQKKCFFIFYFLFWDFFVFDFFYKFFFEKQKKYKLDL